MSYFPFYINITDKTFLVIGGGRVAQEKVNRLRRFTDNIIVIAPQTELTEGSIHNGLRVLQREYREEDLALGDYVVAATGNRELDRKVATDCRRRGIPVNVVDDQAYCDYIFPSIIKKGDLTVAISTAGTSPAYARQLRQEIEEILPPEIESILARMGVIRSEAAARIQDQKRRAEVYKKILTVLIASDNNTSDQEIAEIISDHTNS